MPTKIISVRIDIHTISIAIILLIVLILAIWLLYTTPNTKKINNKQEQFYDLQEDINTEINKLAQSISDINIKQIKYNLTH